jgi:hypothetical protein
VSASITLLRNRPFNLKGGLWFFVSFRIYFSDNTRIRMFIFIVVQSAKFFFQNLTLGYMTKTLNQIILFFLHQNQNIFFSNIGNQNIFFRKKPYLPPPSFKLNGRSLMIMRKTYELRVRLICLSGAIYLLVFKKIACHDWHTEKNTQSVTVCVE